MRLHPRIGGYGRYSSEVDNESTKATWLSHGSDSIELANDPSETRLTIAGTSPKSCWKGLRNMGNTCYLNASLQMLFSVGSFVSSLSTWSGNLTRSIVTVANTLAVPSTPYSRSPDAKPVKAAIDRVTDKFEGYLQRDAHEFLSDLIDQVHVELEAEVKQRADGRGGKDEATETPEGDQVKEEDGYDSMDVKSSSTVKFESQELVPSNVDDATPLPTDEFFRLNIQVRLECTCCGYTR
jgi:ubiquitin C-terminal hydrolase